MFQVDRRVPGSPGKWTKEWLSRSVLLDQHWPLGNTNAQKDTLQILLIKRPPVCLHRSKCPSLWIYWERSHIQQVCRQFWGVWECKPYGSFLSSALLSQDADETQRESLKDEGTSGAQTAEFQVGWNFLSFFWHASWFLRAQRPFSWSGRLLRLTNLI